MATRTRVLRAVGPSEVVTSAELQERLVADGDTKPAARQIISRAARNSRGLWRSSDLKLPRGGRLFARFSFLGTGPFYERVADLLQDARPGLARCLNALTDRGLVLRPHAIRLIAAAPDSPGGRSPFDSELAALAEIGVQIGAKGSSHEFLCSVNRSPDDPDSLSLAFESLG